VVKATLSALLSLRLRETIYQGRGLEIKHVQPLRPPQALPVPSPAPSLVTPQPPAPSPVTPPSPAPSPAPAPVPVPPPVVPAAIPPTA
jgi:hypothetical protein